MVNRALGILKSKFLSIPHERRPLTIVPKAMLGMYGMVGMYGIVQYAILQYSFYIFSRHLPITIHIML